MRDKNRIKPLLADLGKVWERHPDMRLCQLLKVLVQVYGGYKQNDLFYYDDKDLEIAIDKYKKMHTL